MKRTMVEIPQFLQYRLKMYGLTGRQLLLLLLGGGVIASIWQSFMDTRPALAIFCALFTALTTVLLTFFKFQGKPVEAWLVMILVWALLPERLQGVKFRQTFFRVKQEKDGLLELEGGRYLALLKCSFLHVEANEQNIEGFFAFLSGLSFPLSLHLRMRKYPLNGRLSPDVGLPLPLRRLQGHYLSYLHNLVYARPLRVLHCYVMVSANKQERCFEQVRTVQENLGKMQIACRLLSAQEGQVFYQESLVSVGEPVAARIAVKAVCFEISASVREYRAGLVLSRLPGTVQNDFLASFLQQEEEPYDIHLVIEPVDDQQMVSQLQRKAAQFGGVLLAEERQGRKRGNVITRHALLEVERLREQLLLQKNHLYSTTLVIMVQASSRRKISARVKQMRIRLRSLNVQVTPLYFQHQLSLLSFYGQNLLASSYALLLPTDAVAAFYPFIRIPTLRTDILLGATPQGDLVSLDVDGMNNNLAVLGVPGSGKSFFLKVLSARLAFSRVVSVIDIEGEYTAWAEAVGAQRICFTANSLSINPLSLRDMHSLREKIVSFVGFVALLIGGGQGVLSPHEQALVVEATLHAYAGCGITDEPATYGRMVPAMQDFLGSLRQLDPGNDLAYRLEMYMHLFPKQAEETEQKQDRHQVYNLHDLPEQLRAPVMYLLIERFSSLLYDGLKKPHLLIIDEAWFLSKFASGASFLNEFARRARKYKVGLWVGTQQVADLLASGGEQFRGLLDLCETKILFRQEVDDLAKLLKVNTSEERFLHTAGRGAALYVTSKERYMIDVLASEREKKFARGANQ